MIDIKNNYTKIKTRENNKRLSLEASIDRYDRQLRTENWGIEEQRKLYNSKVLLMGADILGEMTLGCLVGLGIGNILVMDNKKKEKRERSFLSSKEGESRVYNIIKTAKKINPYVNIEGYHSKFSPAWLHYENFKPDIIIETTNNAFLKEKTLNYAIKNNIHFISSYSNHTISILSVYNPERNNIDEILNSENIFDDDKEQGSVTAGINAGMIIDELRKFLFRLNDKDNNLEKRIFYNLNSSNRKSLNSDIERQIGNLSQKKVLVVGAGAAGNYVALNLALCGFKEIDIIDYDKIEDTNLNRQILFYEKIGEDKARVLSERIKELRKIKSRSFVYKITEDSYKFLEKNKYDLIFGCLDNLEARYYLNEIAVNFKIPYIDGGTDDLYGDFTIYYPEKTACIECKRSLKPDPIKRSCGEALPGVIIPNIIVGSAMVGEAANIFRGEILDKRFVYDSFNKNRFYLREEQKPKKECLCLNEKVPEHEQLHRLNYHWLNKDKSPNL